MKRQSIDFQKEYNNEVKNRWENTKEYKEFADKTKDYSDDKWQNAEEGLNTVISKFADCKNNGFTHNSNNTQQLVKELQSYITSNFYTCNNTVLLGLGQMYVLDERFKNNIDKFGTGTADYISKAIIEYCK